MTDPRGRRAVIAGAVDELQRTISRELRSARDGLHGAGPSRRRFLQAGAATAMLGGLPWLAACGGDDDDVEERPTPQPRPKETRTLFFNHSHLKHAGKAMMLQVGTKQYPLKSIREMSDVLARERKSNRFLTAVPDASITHAVEGVEVDPEYVTPACIYTETGGGAWTMDAVHLMLPQASSAVAFSQLGSPKESLKRRKYGLKAAASAQDLHEEQALLDSASHAATLIACHKDMLGLDGGAANTVVNGYVMVSNGVFDLDDQLSGMDPASPETTPGTPNDDNGWASLRPVVNKTTGQPFRMDDDNRIVYMPVLHPAVASLVGAGVAEVLPQVQNEASLGADITSRPAGSTLRGTLWVRQDGQPNVVQTATPAADDPAPKYGVDWPAGQNRWLDCSVDVSSLGGGVLQLDITLTNTGLRFLSAYIEFEDEAGNLVALSEMPGWTDGTWVSSPPNFAETYSPGEDGSKTRLPIGGINCIGTVMGVPVITDPKFYGSLEIVLKIPDKVHKVRLLSGGLGTGSNNYPDTIAGGVVGTMLMNYAITTIFAVIGAIPGMDSVYSLLFSLGATFLNDLASGLLDKFSGNDIFSPQFWTDQGLNLINFCIGAFSAYAVGPLVGKFFEGLGAILGEVIAEATVAKAVWFVGIAFCVESALAGIADFALTTTAVAQSPFTYVTEISLSHDFTLTIDCDPGNTSFPKAANAFKVTATFDDGKPVTSEYLPVPSGKTTDYTFTGQPYGGKVQFVVDFVQRALDGSDADNILLGHGTTDKLDNTASSYSLTIEQKQFPISAKTIYQHQLRTYLDAGSRHVWVAEAAPSTPPSAFPCGSAGQVCSFNGIAVRQGNASSRTMLAYSWRGQNRAGGGDVDQSALMDADDPSSAYALATLAKTGGGLTLAVSRDAGGHNNYYVDASGSRPVIRGINFDAAGNPTIDGPGSDRAYGVLNYDSSALLVHPTGVLVSVAGQKQRLEILSPPDAPVTDAVARQSYIAQVLGLTGTRVGCMNSVIGATITNDGTLLVLEGDTNNRIQAFDLSLNPTRYFANAPTPYFLHLDALKRSDGWVHLDVQADFTGLLFVLSRNERSGVYQVSVFDSLARLQAPLATTTSIFAARIGLDHWRTLYSLNFQPLTVQGTGAAPAITEPSVSQWAPCNRGQTCN